MGKSARWIILLACFAFFGFHLANIDYQVLADTRVSFTLLAISSAIAICYRYWGVFVWRTILVNLGANILPSFATLSAIYAKSWMARYIPGSVAWLAGKVYFARNLGISKSRLSVASLVDSGVQLASVAGVSLILISLDQRIDDVAPHSAKILAFLAMFLLLVTLMPKVFNNILGFGYKLLTKNEPHDELKTNGKTIFRSFTLHSFGAFISGTSYYFLIGAISPNITIADYLYIVGAVNLAGAIGTATPFVPSGLGTRDASLYILLAVFLTNEVALVVTVFSRLWSALVDSAFLGLALLVSHASSSEAP